MKKRDIYGLNVFPHKLFIMDKGENSNFSVIKSNIDNSTAILFSPCHLPAYMVQPPLHPATVTPARSPQRARPAKQGRPPEEEDNCQHGPRSAGCVMISAGPRETWQFYKKIHLGSRWTCSSTGRESSAHRICISVAHLGQACLFIDVATPIHLSSVEAGKNPTYLGPKAL